MSTTHHEKASKATEEAMKDADRHSAGTNNAVPEADGTNHARSEAAHLGHVQEHTKPAGNLRHGAAPGELREPPQEVSRVGKEHRKQ